MTIVEINNRHYPTATCWNDLSCRQLIKVMTILEKASSILVAQVALFKIITGISWIRIWFAGVLEVDDKLYLTDFIFDQNTLTRNLIPSFKGLHGPADEFNNMLVSEFVFAEQYYRQYKNADAKEIREWALDRMIATIYRPAKKGYDKATNPDGDIRESYNDNLTPLYADRVRRWPAIIKLCILHWFEGCLFKLMSMIPDDFGGPHGEVAKYGMWSIMRGVAEKGIHGDINQVEKMYVKVFMMELTELHAEAEKIKNFKPTVR